MRKLTTSPASPALLSRRPKLGEEVTRYLRDAILTGEYRAGQRIQVEDLANRLGVSAMPSREALTMLLSEGLIESLPRRGYRVARITPGDIRDVFCVHSLIAGALAERAAESISAEDVDRLGQIQDRIERVSQSRLPPSQRAAQLSELNFGFHRLINQVPDAPRLRWFLRAAARFVPRHFYREIPRWSYTAIDGHRDILAALAAHDAPAARDLMSAHVVRAGTLVIEHLESRGFFG